MSTVTRKKNISTLIILAIVLLVPGFLYVVVNKMGSSNAYVKLPVYGEKSLSGKTNTRWGRTSPDTIFHTLDSVAFHNDKGNVQTFLGADAEVTVAHLFYTEDATLSKAMLSKLKAVVDGLSNNPMVHFYSIAVAENDKATALAPLVQKYAGPLADKWFFVSQAQVDILQYAQNEMLLDALVDPSDSRKFILSNNFILIDSKKRIRGFYDVSLKSDMERLADEIRLQVVEEIRNKPLKVEKK